MKNLFLLIALIVSVSCFSQHNCPPGYSFMPTLSTTSLTIIADTCLPDSICKKLICSYKENMCGEMGLYMTDDKTSFERSGTWDSINCNCIWEEIWKKKIKGNWITITKQEYNRINKVKPIK